MSDSVTIEVASDHFLTVSAADYVFLSRESTVVCHALCFNCVTKICVHAGLSKITDYRIKLQLPHCESM